MAGDQYLKGLNHKDLPPAMHDLPAIYARVTDIVRAGAVDCFADDGNARTYPHPPKLTDREVVCLAVTAEALECDSENTLYAKLASYEGFLPHRCGRQSFNRRRRRLRPLIDEVNRALAAFMDDGSELLTVDSMPIETVRVTNASQSRACRRPELDALCADKTYHASTKRWIVGYKLHAIFTASGIYVEHVLRPASHHDLTVLREITDLPADDMLGEPLTTRLTHRRVLGDKGYISAPVQLSFADNLGVDLQAIPKDNDLKATLWPFEWRRARRYVETVFSQLCDEVRVKRNLAKRFTGINTRVSTKLLVRTVKQFLNYHTGRPINQTKHCWLA